MKSRMFPFVDGTCNLVGGRCPFGCVYCWANGEKGLVKRYGMKKYQAAQYFFDLKITIQKDKTCIFLCDMLDLFAPNVPSEIIDLVLKFIERHPDIKFLLLTKNPKRYLNFGELWRRLPNVILGATIESNQVIYDTPSKYHFYDEISKAPSPFERLYLMRQLRKLIIKHDLKFPLFICIEPVLDFSNAFGTFVSSLKEIAPEMVAIGYDNYHFRLPEPSLLKTQELIKELKRWTIVVEKSIRKAWYEDAEERRGATEFGDAMR